MIASQVALATMFIGDSVTYNHFGPEPPPQGHKSIRYKLFGHDEDVRSHASFVLLGEPKSGKSTIARQLLKEVKAIAPENNCFPLSEAQDRANPQPHMVLFEGPDRRVTMIDCPADEKYLVNLARGLIFRDHVVLAVDAQETLNAWDGILSSGSSIGQSQLKMAATMQVPSVIVVVTKLDLVDDAQTESKYNQIKRALEPVLATLKFNKTQFIPRDKSNLPWYTGPSLLEAIQELSYEVNTDETLVSVTHHEEPIVVNEAKDIKVKCYGRVLANRIKTNNDHILLCNMFNQINGARVISVTGEYASQGQFAEFVLGGVTSERFKEVMSLYPLLCDYEYAAEPTSSGGGQVLAHDQPITLNQKVTFYWAGMGFSGTVTHISDIRDQNYQTLGSLESIPPYHIGDIRVEPDDKNVAVIGDDDDLTPQFRGIVIVSNGSLLATGSNG